MAQQLRALATKPDSLSSVPGNPHGGRRVTLKAALQIYVLVYMDECVCAHTCTNQYNSKTKEA